MYASVISATLAGIDSVPVRVEADLAPGLPGMHLVGLPDTAVREARERVKAAVRNSGLQYPQRRLTVNLAPADLRKEGPSLDLAIALALLLAQTSLPPDCLRSGLVVGELALSGALRPIRGALGAALLARQRGLRRLLLPRGNFQEVSMIADIELVPLATLAEAVDYLRGRSIPEVPAVLGGNGEASPPDLSEVRGQLKARRALEIAAAGGHNLLLSGPPGTGKSMLANRLPGLLPPLSEEASLSVTRISSAAGQRPVGLIRIPPIRAPHHSVSAGALLGGRGPGEISMAHHGVLFLDEIGEFPQRLLDLLRQPLESGVISVQRDRVDRIMPASFQLVAARNPCPCGYADVPGYECRCTRAQVQAYERRLSGPMLDRIDLQVAMSLIPARELPYLPPGESSAAVRKRVQAGREIAVARQGMVNAALTGDRLRRHCSTDDSGADFLDTSLPGMRLSARGYDRLLRTARTIADLDQNTRISWHHLAEALGYLAPTN